MVGPRAMAVASMVVAAILARADGNPAAPKDGPAMKMLVCDACNAVMGWLAKDVKFLVETGKMWKPKDLRDRIGISCGDPMLPTGAMRDACGYLMADYNEGIARDVALRWTEGSEEFEEDIVPREFCEKLGVCKEGHKTLNHQISFAERKEKDLKWEKEQKAKDAKRKPKKKSKQDDEEEEEAEQPRRPRLASADDDSDSEDEMVTFRGGLMREEAPKQAAVGGGTSVAARCGSGGGGGTRPPGGMTMLGKVVAIADPRGSSRVIVCTLHPNERSGSDRSDNTVKETDTLLKAKPTDHRMPWILIQINDVTRGVLGLPGKLDPFKLWPIQMIGWKETSTLPLGRLKGQCLGRAGDLDAEERHALIEHQLDEHDVDFKDENLNEVEQIVIDADRNFPEEVAKRNDLRKKRIFTIDPATARDLDDAIHVDIDEERQEVEIGVHIADVGHFLKLGSLADKEAQFRTTSVYLIGRVLPMLPHALCNHLCSLNPNEPKLAFSAFFRLKIDTGELVEDPAPWFEKTAICSVCRLNYDEVQEVLDGKEIERPPVYGGYTWQHIYDDLFLLYDVCGKVRRGRFEGGALAISKQKMIFHTRESEDGIPTGYHLEHHSASHWIIEELMLLANRCVAKHLANSALNSSAVLRNHEAPDPKKAEKLSNLMKENLGLDWDAFDAGSIYKSCQAIYREYGSMLGLCVEMMAMRAGMKQAQYFVYNDDTDTRHFALDFEYYTHFTSPIRRYPDVMVHRVLNALLTGDEEGFQVEGFQVEDAALEQVAACNEKKAATRKCSEQLDRAVFCIFLRARKSWFYTVGTVLAFSQDSNKGDKDTITVYCSQLGKETKALLQAGSADLEQLGLFQDGVEDTLTLPESYRFCSRGLVELEWLPPDGVPGGRRRQCLQTLSCVPIVIIPTNTVPIDYSLFFVSPFHPQAERLSEQVPEVATRGFTWREAEVDGVEVVHDARAAAAASSAAEAVRPPPGLGGADD
mmetsp:Transcript_26438/g.66550  ORF Transcript_26438/g.66550 Transcript_26438/m.66550 type:complete len:981 (-) Transcript_26438:61-3003(-)